jgi:hypothetical protein
VLVDDHKQKSLATALRVNKSWFANGVPVLYRVLTHLQGILDVLSSPNIDTYLSSIHHIVFIRCYAATFEKIKDICPTLPELRSISVAPSVVSILEMERYYARELNCEKEYLLDPISVLLGPSFCKFSCAGVILTRRFLKALKDKCPHLEKLEIKFMRGYNVREIDEDYLRQWFLDMPSVHSISIFNRGNIENLHQDDPIHQLVSVDLISIMLARPLRALGLECYPGNLCALDASEIFEILRDLRIVLRRDIFECLPRFRYLFNLHVRIDGTITEKLIPYIASLAHLKSLRMIFGQLLELKTEEIMLLGNLHELKRLEIRSSQQGLIEDYFNVAITFLPIKVPTTFDEDCLNQLLSSFPNMRHFFILIDWEPNSSRVLKSVTTSWPNLEYLGLGYKIKLYESLIQSLGNQTLFPCLQYFMPLKEIVMGISVDLAESRA